MKKTLFIKCLKASLSLFIFSLALAAGLTGCSPSPENNSPSLTSINNSTISSASLSISSVASTGNSDTSSSKSSSSSGFSSSASSDNSISFAAIAGVTPPVYAQTPVTAITETAQYTGTVTWSGSPITFSASTVYTATIRLTAKTGFTLTGVTANFFTVAGATSVSNTADSGVITAIFPATSAAPITIAAIAGVTPPVIGATPVTAITETAQYTGSVTWDGDWAGLQTFAGSKAYTATITLTVKPGYTSAGVAANLFTVAGASSVSNPADSGVITAVFPATATVSIGDAVLGGKVVYILQPGDLGYVPGETHGLIVATSDQSDQSTGIKWDYEKQWYDSYTGNCLNSWVVIGTGTAIGTGYQNTINIINHNGAGTDYAAGLAHAYHGGGYTDWYLPSKDELKKLYDNRVAIYGTDLVPGVLWSSSEHDDYTVYSQDLLGGIQSYTYKDPHCLAGVRAFRSF